MRIGLTVEAEDEVHDVVVECADDTTVDELEAALRARLGCPLRLPGPRHGLAAHSVVHGARIANGGRRRAPLPGRLRLQVVSGPDSGVVFELGDGEHVLGRGGTLAWADRAMSRRHLRVRASALGVEVCDLGSRHGTRIDGIACEPGQDLPWPLGSTLQVGNSLVVCALPSAEHAVWEQAAPGWRRLARPPRLRVDIDQPYISFPQEPQPPGKRGLPWMAIGVPLVMGVGVAALLRRPEYLLFALMSPLMAAVTVLQARRSARRSHRAAMDAYLEEAERAAGCLEEALAKEQARRREELPDAATLITACLMPGRRLWERRRADPDFLRIRVGSTDQPSNLVVPGRSGPGLQAPMVPCALDLRDAGVLGVVGASTSPGVLRWLVGQYLGLCAPEDLGIVFVGDAADPAWAWLTWAPHVRSEDLTTLLEQRTSDEASADAPVVVVVPDYPAARATEGLGLALRDGPRVGVFLVCGAASEAELPEQAAMIIHADSPGSSYGCVEGEGRRCEGVLLEQVSVAWAERVARAIAPYQGTVREGAATVPDLVGLVDVLDVGSVGDIRERWRAHADTESGLAAVVGVGAEGTVSLDLVRDGPHALIAGMTGSGKSDLVQSLVVSLAASHGPDRLNVVLIDYKGDSAFRLCGDLPHVVGKVTDLNPELVERALISLRAELAYRKRVVATRGTKDIDGCRGLLPRLVIVIDEFAELARELPEFIEGLVSIAQTGRSLGVHLILATQRPSGVVSPAIRANTNLRICLRVADPADSVDVVGCPDAARLRVQVPGRALVRSGAGVVREFQVGWISAGRTVTSNAQPRVELLAGRSFSAEVGTVDATASVALADWIQQAAVGMPELRQPWLAPLPNTLVRPAALRAQNPRSFAFGISDLPSQQRQDLACFDLGRDGHLMVAGASGSGRTQVLRAIATSIAGQASPEEVHLYVIDGGAGGLEKLHALPHCGAVVSRSDTERMRRLLGRLCLELDSRSRCAAIVVMLDRWESLMPLLAETPDLLDMVFRILREGPAAGVHMAITGDRSLLLNPRMAAATEKKYVMRMADKSDYLLAGLGPRQVSDLPVGRCIGPGGAITQVFALDTGSEAGACASVREEAGPFPIDELPVGVDVLTALGVRREIGHPAVIVGVGGDVRTAFEPDPRRHCFLVAGPPRSGRSSVLLGAAQCALATGGRVVILAPPRSPLRQVEENDRVLLLDAAGLAEALAAMPEGPLLVLVDDVDEHQPRDVEDVFAQLAQGMFPRVLTIFAGAPDFLGSGLHGWRAQARKANQGLVLSPRSISDGDAVGLRLPRSAVGGPLQPGTGVLHQGDGAAISVATILPGPA